MKTFLAVSCFVVALVGCSPAKPDPVAPTGADASHGPVDAGDYDAGTSTAGQACSAMASLGCAEAYPPSDCAETIDRLSQDMVTGIHAACIASARTTDAMHACHVRCLSR